MAQPPDLALITESGGFFSRPVKEEGEQQWRLRNCRLTMLQLGCKQGEKALAQGLIAANRAGCRLAAIKADRRCGIASAPLHITDGRMLALSAITRRLDVDCPGWRKDTVCLSADDNFSCLTARWLAPYSCSLHICGQDAARRQALTRLLYHENGLIAAESRLPPADTLFIQPPGLQAGPAVGSAFTWRNWPIAAIDGLGEQLGCHLAEGLLLAAGSLPPGLTPLLMLRLLHHRSMYFEMYPI